MLQHLFRLYGVIDEIDLKGNSVKMMGVYDPTEPPTLLIIQLKKGQKFAISVAQLIADDIMVSNVITLLEQTEIN